MPTPDAHRQAIADNQQLIDAMSQNLTPQNAPWVTVLAFYKALHLVELLFHLDNRSPCRRGASSHETRGELLQNTKHYQAVHNNYATLKRASEVARYLEVAGHAYDSFAEYMSEEQVRSRILGHYLPQLEAAVGRILSPQHGSQFLTPAGAHRT